MSDREKQFELEGEQAAREGKVFDCPYAFAKVNVDQETFDREFRYKLDGWTRGYVRISPPRKNKKRVPK